MAARIKTVIFALTTVLFLSSCGLQGGGFKLVDAKMASGVDENILPQGAADIFPKEQSKLSCWFKWQGAEINTEIITKWHYITDDVHIADHAFVISKKDGAGSVEITMPEGRTFPQGQYKVDIVFGKQILKSLRFKIQ